VYGLRSYKLAFVSDIGIAVFVPKRDVINSNRLADRQIDQPTD